MRRSMTRRGVRKNGQGAALATAMALLVQNQAESISEHRLLNRELLALKKESEDRWVRIEALLVQHDRMLRELPKAIRKKIGYQK